ncbi:hypothetical protein EI546_06430 [Aequorivita sp. H23M31]|uniref:Uncharacterized protein n=1 Tax=Aequorivita ciconiae TaxID=2494375 RepID=A0A410G293_9FLAO|nr:hypothetical protein [Aequorivita sp. H23M31]QAA81386.1 hypothetical protein EI546_06430 [Aequorivita sp. H23M31]
MKTRAPFIPNDVSRCNNDRCGLRLHCARYLQLKLDAKTNAPLRSVTRFGNQGITTQCDALIPVDNRKISD